mmetsp:Transcript_4894/g.14827  ORF Transcript_4894/g.14827 Transcript_4894/m.14827 type:complete len:203 (-) Transcript_4894:1232-1840(-)|eukprot:scaffold149059_cov32-Tisochrysis_lutea.AAC.1
MVVRRRLASAHSALNKWKPAALGCMPFGAQHQPPCNRPKRERKLFQPSSSNKRKRLFGATRVLDDLNPMVSGLAAQIASAVAGILVTFNTFALLIARSLCSSPSPLVTSRITGWTDAFTAFGVLGLCNTLHSLTYGSGDGRSSAGLNKWSSGHCWIGTAHAGAPGMTPARPKGAQYLSSPQISCGKISLRPSACAKTSAARI